MSFLISSIVVCVLIILRTYLILPRTEHVTRRRRRSSELCSLAIFLGSGGHTAEALTYVSALDFSRYTPRTYIISQGDNLSARKASSLELSKNTAGLTTQYSILTIPRARRVHQSLATTPPTAAISLLACIYHVTIKPLFSNDRPTLADVLLINGPGTCSVLCFAVYVNKFFGLTAPQIIYVESFARVKSLSLSGKLLRPVVDRFIVQWPQLLQAARRGEYHGWLV